MYGVIYALAKLFGFVKDAVSDDINDVMDRSNNKINNVAYVGKKGLQSYETGHSLSFINSHTYIDNVTFKTVKVPLTDEDLVKEEKAKEAAINNGYGVYCCSDFYLPDKTVGRVFKSIDNSRLYVRRSIKNSLSNKMIKINNIYYISIMPDNYGHVERNWQGNPISGNDLLLRDYYFRLDYSFWNDDNYIWEA